MTKPKLFVIGDSISMQYGPWLKSYVSDSFRYGRKGEYEEWGDLNYESKTNGGDSSNVLTVLKDMIDCGFKTDYLLLNCGLHDIKVIPPETKRQIPIDQYKENLHAIMKLTLENDIKVIWVRTTPLDETIHNTLSPDMNRHEADVVTYNTAADDVMKEFNIPMIDLNGFTSSLDEKLYCDHVHFYDPVRKLQAAYIAGFLKGMLA